MGEQVRQVQSGETQTPLWRGDVLLCDAFLGVVRVGDPSPEEIASSRGEMYNRLPEEWKRTIERAEAEIEQMPAWKRHYLDHAFDHVGGYGQYVHDWINSP